MHYFVILIIIAALILIMGGCSSTPTTTSPPSAPVTSKPPASSTSAAPSTSAKPTSPATSSSGPTFGSLSDAGKTIFANRCAKCHGNNGQGVTAPAVTGSSANLAKYKTAQGLLSYTSASMPFDAPGSLSHQDYLNVLAYLLVQNNQTPANSPFNESQLESITLK